MIQSIVTYKHNFYIHWTCFMPKLVLLQQSGTEPVVPPRKPIFQNKLH